jgi:hypothetical protein
MANVKISALPASDTITGVEEVALTQGGVTKKATLADIKTGLVPTPVPLFFKLAQRISLIEVNNAFTGITASDGGSGTTLLTSTGVHSLTAPGAVGVDVYIKSGTGWTPGFYKVTDVPNTTSFKINIPFTGQGSPVVATQSTEVVAVSFTIPPLGMDTTTRITYMFSSTDSTSTSKTYSVRWNGDVINTFYVTTSPTSSGMRIVQNLNSSTNKIISFPNSQNSYAGSSAQPVLKTIDTSIPSTISLTLKTNGPNIGVYVNLVLIEVLI